mmetsp:Transcript_7478/g.33756  ORF Transcript_7478/g.33756 Transcript_7478/m.33756 type:complete len:313 (-) Transcript_7478:895-1833(-)
MTSRASSEAVTSPWLSRPETDPTLWVRDSRLERTSDGESSCIVNRMLPSDRLGVGEDRRRVRCANEPSPDSLGPDFPGDWLTTGSPVASVSRTSSRHRLGDCLDLTTSTSRDPRRSNGTSRSNRSTSAARMSSPPMNRDDAALEAEAGAEPIVVVVVLIAPPSSTPSPASAPHARHRRSFDLAPPITSHVSYTPRLSPKNWSRCGRLRRACRYFPVKMETKPTDPHDFAEAALSPSAVFPNPTGLPSLALDTLPPVNCVGGGAPNGDPNPPAGVAKENSFEGPAPLSRGVPSAPKLTRLLPAQSARSLTSNA